MISSIVAMSCSAWARQAEGDICIAFAIDMGDAEATDDLDVEVGAAGDEGVGVERAALLCTDNDVNEHEQESEARGERGNVGTHGRPVRAQPPLPQPGPVTESVGLAIDEDAARDMGTPGAGQCGPARSRRRATS